jgi:hypothetical protein
MTLISDYVQIYVKMSINNIHITDRLITNPIIEFKLRNHISTKNMFLKLSEKIYNQLGLNREKYLFIKYQPCVENFENTYIDYNTSSCLSIKEEFNTNEITLYFKLYNSDDINIIKRHLNLNIDIDTLMNCPICLEDYSVDTFLRRYNCQHSICINCHHNCIHHNINRCSLCRQPEILRDLLL